MKKSSEISVFFVVKQNQTNETNIHHIY